MLVLGCFAEFKLHKLKLAEVIRELSFVFDRLNNKIYRSCNMIVAVLLMDDDLIKWSKMKLNRRERTSPSVLTWVITFPLDIGWISCSSFYRFWSTSTPPSSIIQWNICMCFVSVLYLLVAGCGSVCLSHSLESIKEAVAVSPVLGDEQYERMSRVTEPANNSKEFILVNGHVGH